MLTDLYPMFCLLETIEFLKFSEIKSSLALKNIGGLWCECHVYCFRSACMTRQISVRL